MESRINDCTMRHNMGFNCAQSVACTYADLVGCDEETMFKMTEGLGLGMGGMQGTCGGKNSVSLFYRVQVTVRQKSDIVRQIQIKLPIGMQM